MTKMCSGFLFAICAFAGVSLATTEEKQWIRDEHGCSAYNPTPQPKTGERIRWNGSCNQGYAEGPGRLEWFDESGNSDGWAEGTFEHGYLQGFGESLGPKGSHYRGEFRYSRKNGRGKLDTPLGIQYEGLFRDGQPEGFGTTVWPDGMRYEGEYKNGKRDGHGVFIGPSGDLRVEVNSKDGQVEGRATVSGADGTSYHIEVLNGVCVGLTDWHPAATELQKCKDHEGSCEVESSALANAIGCLPDSGSH